MTLVELIADVQIYLDVHEHPILKKLFPQFLAWLQEQHHTEFSREELETLQQEWIDAWEHGPQFNMDDYMVGFGFFQSTEWIDDVEFRKQDDIEVKKEYQRYLDEVAAEREGGGLPSTGNPELDELLRKMQQSGTEIIQVGGPDGPKGKRDLGNGITIDFGESQKYVGSYDQFMERRK